MNVTTWHKCVYKPSITWLDTFPYLISHVLTQLRWMKMMSRFIRRRFLNKLIISHLSPHLCHLAIPPICCWPCGVTVPIKNRLHPTSLVWHLAHHLLLRHSSTRSACHSLFRAVLKSACSRKWSAYVLPPDRYNLWPQRCFWKCQLPPQVNFQVPAWCCRCP